MFEITNYITVEEAAARLGYTRANVTRLIREKKLPALRRGRKYFILPVDLDRLVNGTVSDPMFK